MTKEALKLALEALEDLGMKHFENTGEVLYKETFAVIKEALAQPEQEPVAWMNDMGTHIDLNVSGRGTPLYTTSSKRPSRSDIKPLTDEEIEDIWADCPADWDDKINVLTLARAIEAAHGIKEAA